MRRKILQSEFFTIIQKKKIVQSGENNHPKPFAIAKTCEIKGQFITSVIADLHQVLNRAFCTKM